ncbi:MAG: hypothetical protein A2W89_10620 [Bacteroidetes bacterium GWE2_42_39]|nr:MAG: hypothetical protein A2W92_05885 [Bacteroidetes bacterium GWA2_42_15]OFX98728.1 MAG: hypothetical protein A2W89_10620 [Bacteroidetes bacterium GWE2_42_39]
MKNILNIITDLICFILYFFKIQLIIHNIYSNHSIKKAFLAYRYRIDIMFYFFRPYRFRESLA